MGVRMKWVVGSLCLVLALAASAKDVQNADGTYTIDVVKHLQGGWTHIVRDGPDDFAFQRVTVVQYQSGPINPSNVDVDVLLKKTAKGANNTVVETSLVYGTLICDRSGHLPSQFPVAGATKFITSDDGLPGAPRDSEFTINPLSPVMVTIEQGSVYARMAKMVCSAI